MKITRTSVISGITRTFDIPVDPEDMAAYKNGTNIQYAMPYLSDNDREFILSGITPDEWDAAFAHTEDGDDEDEVAF